MSGRREPTFLARDTYRQRRMIDAARFLPFLGAFAFIVPTLIADRIGTAPGYVVLFGGWIVLIVLSRIVTGRLQRHSVLDDPPDDAGNGAG